MEIKTILEQENTYSVYPVLRSMANFYGKIEVLLRTRDYTDILDKTNVKNSYKDLIENHNVYIDQPEIIVGICNPQCYSGGRRNKRYIGRPHHFVNIELHYTIHNYEYDYAKKEDGTTDYSTRVFTPKLSKRLLVERKKFESRAEAIQFVNYYFMKEFGIKDILGVNTVNCKHLFRVIKECCEHDEQGRDMVHKNFLLYQTWLEQPIYEACLEKLLRAEFVTMSERGWIKATEKGLARLADTSK